MKKKRWILWIPVIIIVLGMAGYMSGEGYGFYEALLASMKLIRVELDPLPPNLLIEMGRWLGIIFLCGLVYAALATILEHSRIWTRSRRDDAVAVHEEGIYAQMLMGSLGPRGIRSDNKLSFKVPRQVICFESDDETINFYQKHSKELKKAEEIHLCLNMGSHISLDQNNVYLTNISEVKAISFWQQYFCTKKEKIAIIGSGQLAEAVLYWGLLTNVVDRDCHLNYLIIGDFDRFQAVHPDLAAMLDQYGADNITFRSDPWHRNMESLDQMDRIILCNKTWENISTANSLSDMNCKAQIYAFTDNMSINSLINGEKCTMVGALSDENAERILLMDDVHEAGRLCHASYMLSEKGNGEELTYSSVKAYEKTEEFRTGYNKNGQTGDSSQVSHINGWNSLDAFTRGSNYAAAIHDPLKYKLLKDQGVEIKGKDLKNNEDSYRNLDPDTRDYLQEIEHIRWCRYHFLNNWKAPEGQLLVDGKRKAKDPEKRLHSCLVPYALLSEDDKKKDSYFYKTLALRMGD